jgi:hypothetical protein
MLTHLYFTTSSTSLKKRWSDSDWNLDTPRSFQSHTRYINASRNVETPSHYSKSQTTDGSVSRNSHLGHVPETQLVVRMFPTTLNHPKLSTCSRWLRYAHRTSWLRYRQRWFWRQLYGTSVSSVTHIWSVNDKYNTLMKYEGFMIGYTNFHWATETNFVVDITAHVLSHQPFTRNGNWKLHEVSEVSM